VRVLDVGDVAVLVALLVSFEHVCHVIDGLGSIENDQVID